MNNFTEQIILDDQIAKRIFGPADCFLRIIKANVLCQVAARGNMITLLGQKESVQRATAFYLSRNFGERAFVGRK